MHHLDRGQKRSARHAFPQLVVPESMKCEILSNVHNDVPVPILVCTKLFIKRVEDWCKSCVDCAMKKSPNDFHCCLYQLKVPLTKSLLMF